MKKLFICSTVYQLIVAIQIRITIFKKKEVDVIVTNEIHEAQQLCQRLNSLRIFDNVFCIEGKNTSLDSGKSIYLKNMYIKKLQKSIIGKKVEILEKGRYNEIFFANIGGLNLRLATFLSSHNIQAKMNLYEEGISSYSRIFGDIFERLYMPGRGIIKSYLTYGVLKKVTSFYYFEPQVMVWECKGEIVKIPPISSDIQNLKKILNYIFCYEQLRDSYSEKVIFFEESYIADGDYVDDMGIIKMLETIYQKEDIFVKTHPRNSTNRFQNEGYKTNKDSIMPWEVIALNLDMRDKILVSISSTALVNSFLLLNTDAKLIFAYQQVVNKNERLRKTIEVIEKIKLEYPSAFALLQENV